jgi:hypothetical protein
MQHTRRASYWEFPINLQGEDAAMARLLRGSPSSTVSQSLVEKSYGYNILFDLHG